MRKLSFYSIWGPSFLAILIASSIANFYLGVWLRKRPEARRLWTGIIFNLALLSFFKYLPALSGSSSLFQRIAMPAGMSFWTFQALSYLFDTYNEVEMDPSLLEFCLYMAFWPTVMMGPVCRLPKMLSQFREPSRISSVNVVPGLQRVGAGLLMKLILAPLLGTALGGFDDTRSSWSGLDVWFLAMGFGFQLFFDFAGYSNIVIGAAKIFGFQIEENFDSPYLASTPSLIWNRWHMSLSSWIRDYVFVPMATFRRAPWWRYFALILSMTLFGLWHGARLTLFSGACIKVYSWRFIESSSSSSEDSTSTSVALLPTCGWAITFSGITLSWVLFRANDIHAALVMFGAVLSPSSYRQVELPRNYYCLVATLVAGYFAYHIVLDSPYLRRMKAYLQSPNPDSRFLQYAGRTGGGALSQ